MPAPDVARPSFIELFATWGWIGLVSFGGPAGQIALMHRVVVDEKNWLSERQYLSALNFCMLLPGPEAMQLATYVGWRTHGIAGGLVAGLLFVLPGAAVILALSAIYAAFGSVPLVQALFVGIKAAVLALVVEALIKVSRRALKMTADWVIAAAAFAALYFFDAPFPLVILAAATFGFFRARATLSDDVPLSSAGGLRPVDRPTAATTLTTISLWLGIWLTPLLIVHLALGSDHVLTELGWLFAKLAVVTFGGAYAVLAYLVQEIVQGYGWLTAGEMLDALGLAETTPGPLILVTQFVGFLAAFKSDGGGQWTLAVAGAAITLWATFAPCFLWIFAGAPYLERVTANRKLASALSAITAAVVGVIFSLALWFAISVLLGSQERVTFGPLSVALPTVFAPDWAAIGLTVLAAALIFGARLGVVTTLTISAVAALGMHIVVSGRLL
ncbi:MAG: chromate efflux transporter [Hyphomicrobiaceae bacterium]